MLLILRGPSNSFKSTFARNFNPTYIISHDDIRERLFGSKSFIEEDFRVKDIVNTILRCRLKRNLDVVIDSTNIPLEIIDGYLKVASENNSDALIFSFKRDYDSCVAGNSDRFSSSGVREDLVEVSTISSQYFHYGRETPKIKKKYPAIFYEFDVSIKNIDKVYNKLMSIKDKVK